MTDTTHDGQPFGITRTATTFHRLALNATGATLFAVTEDGEEELIWIDARQWSNIADMALADFNPRLAAKSAPPGLWPEAGGTVRLHPSLGRELEMLMHCASDGRVDSLRHIAIWSTIDGRDRFAIWTRWRGLAIAPSHWVCERTQGLIHLLRLHVRNNRVAMAATAEAVRANAARAEDEARMQAIRAYLLHDDFGPLERFAAARRTPEESAQLERIVANRYVTMRRGVETIESDDVYSWRMRMRREAVAAARARGATVTGLADAA